VCTKVIGIKRVALCSDAGGTLRNSVKRVSRMQHILLLTLPTALLVMEAISSSFLNTGIQSEETQI